MYGENVVIYFKYNISNKFNIFFPMLHVKRLCIFSFDKLTCLFFKRIFHSKIIISLSNLYVVARTLQSKNISGPRLTLNLAWLSSSLVKFRFYNAIFICLLSTFILNVIDTARARLWDSPSRKLIASFTITAGWDWASRSSKTFH